MKSFKIISPQNTFLLIFFLFLTASSYLLAGQTGKIVGTVTEGKSGEPMIGANVVLENKFMGASADQNGYYVILNVPPGTYTLIVSMIGYKSVRVNNVRVSVDQTTEINVTLSEEVLELEKEVVVTAKRPLVKKDLTSSELSVSLEEMKNLPVENLGDLLQLKAGVIIDAGGGIHIRGGRTSEVGYMVDGISISDKFGGGGGQTTNVDIQFMQEVKIVSGVFNAEYGQAMSGIVDIITRQGSDRFEANLIVSLGDYLSINKEIFLNLDKINPLSFKDIKANISGPLNLFNKHFSYSVAFRRYENEGWLYGKRRFNPWDSSYQQGKTFYIQESGDNKIISLNSYINYNFQTKLNLDLFSDLKLSDIFLYDNSTAQYYNHLYKYNPDGLPKNYTSSFTNIFTLTYIFSSNTFLNIKYSSGYNESASYTFKDINDPRYVNPELLRQLTSYSFFTGGTDMSHNKRNNLTNTINGYLLSQVNKYNEIKTGFELKFTGIRLDNKTAKYGDTVKIFDYNRYFNEGNFNYKPIDFAFYIQDKIELESIIINAGLRYDYFNSRGKIPEDSKDPDNSSKVNSKAQHQISPRLGIAFPISATGSFHFSYGHFFQIPPLEYLYANPNFRVGPGGLYTLMGNANLKAQSTVAYEVGLNYGFFDVMGMEIIGYYKDVTNLLGTEIRDTYIRSDRYAIYANRDYGKIKGFTISVFKRPTFTDNISATLDYTLQIAEGNATDPNDAFNRAQSYPPKKTNIQVIPLNWDQRHTVNFSLFYVKPNDFNLGLIAKYESGFPYTPEIQAREISFENSAWLPSKFNVDLQFNKDFSFGNYILSLFLKVYNLFDQKNEMSVFRDTGRAGYSLVGQYTPEYQGPNTLSEFFIRPDFYSKPRKIVLGINVNFNF